MDLLVSVLPFVLIMGVMYFFMIRPQQRQAQEKQRHCNNWRLTRGC